MLVADTDDLVVPRWAFFCRAVIDAGELPLTASREGLQESAELQIARKRIGFRLLTGLIIVHGMAPEVYQDILRLHPDGLKALAAHAGLLVVDAGGLHEAALLQIVNGDEREHFMEVDAVDVVRMVRLRPHPDEEAAAALAVRAREAMPDGSCHVRVAEFDRPTVPSCGGPRGAPRGRPARRCRRPSCSTRPTGPSSACSTRPPTPTSSTRSARSTSPRCSSGGCSRRSSRSGCSVPPWRSSSTTRRRGGTEPAGSPSGRRHSDQRRRTGTGGRVTGTTASRSWSPAKSSGFVVNSGRSSAIAVAAIIRSATRRRGFRPLERTAAATRP
jgi:hypothetical protein